jgi:hypothetical protein
MGGRHYNVQPPFNGCSIPGWILVQSERIRLLIRLIVSSEEFPDPEPYLHGVDSRIRRRKPCVREVHVAQFEADIVLRAENVHTQRRLVHEVDCICPDGNVVACQQKSPSQFEIRREASVALEIPLQSQRIEADAVSRVCRLEGEKYGNSVDRVLKTAAQKSGKMWVSEDPSVAQARVEHSGMAAPAAHGMSAARPDLDFVAAFLGSSLTCHKRRRSHQHYSQKRSHK